MLNLTNMADYVIQTGQVWKGLPLDRFAPIPVKSFPRDFEHIRRHKPFEEAYKKDFSFSRRHPIFYIRVKTSKALSWGLSVSRGFKNL